MAVLSSRLRQSVSAALLVAELLACGGVRAESLEDAVKATYVYKFAPFVTWPASIHGDAFTICVYGSDDITSLLPQATVGQDIDGRRIAVRSIAGAEIPADCQVLYIARWPTGAAVLVAARGRPVLTVTDENGIEHGIVRLIVIDHHVRFDIDTRLATEAGLSISSKLLGLAVQVRR